MERRRALKLLLGLLLTLLVGGVAAGGMARAQETDTDQPIQVVSTKPDDGAQLTATPAEIVLRFNGILPDIEAIVQLQNENRELQSIGQPVAFDQRQALRVRVLKELPAGKYTLTWLIRPRNGDQVPGKLSFELSAPATTTTVGPDGKPAEEVKVDDDGLGIKKSNHYGGMIGTLGRTLGYLGLAGLAGALILIALVWAEGVEYVLTLRHLWLCWIVGVIGCLFTVASAVSDLKGVSVARGMVPTEWSDLLDTTLGKALVIRMVAMAGCLWVAARPERVVDSGTQLAALGIPAIGLATYGWSRSGPDSSMLLIPAGIVHAIAVAAWFGGAAILTRVVLAGPGDADLVGAVRGFRRIAVPALLLTIASGAVQTSANLGGLGNLFDSSYGKIFFLKILAVVAMAFVATANRQYARARLSRANHLDARPAAKLRRSVRTEVMTGALVLLLTGWLAGTATPGSAASDPAKTNKDTYQSTDGSFRADIIFGPKKVGARVELHFKLKSPKTISEGLVTFTPKDTTGTGIEVPIKGSPNYGFGPEQGFQFSSSGTWVITITGKGPDGEDLPTITREFTVANQDGSEPQPAAPTTTVATTKATVPDTTVNPADTVDAANTKATDPKETDSTTG